MQGNSGGAAQYIPVWVMWVQIIWKVLFPKELLQTAFSAGIMDQIKAPGCARVHCWAVFSLTAGTTDVGWICHICSLVRSNHSWLRITAHHGLGIHPRCQPLTQKSINIGMCERAGMCQLCWVPGAELGSSFEEKLCPTSAEKNRQAVVRNHDRIFQKKGEMG